MGDLSQNFSRWEFSCNCGCGFDTVDAMLLVVLQDLSDTYNHMPVNISGPNRCPEHNKKVGGAKDSEHMKAKAVDIKVQRMSPQVIYNYLNKKYPNTFGIGIYVNRVHIDVRKEKARWDKRSTGFNTT